MKKIEEEIDEIENENELFDQDGYYVCNEVGNGAKKIRAQPKLEFNSDLFSA